MLPTPAGAEYTSESQGKLPSLEKLTWEFPELAPGPAKQLCATFKMPQPGTMRFEMSARGELAAAQQSICESKVDGIPAILLEVVDMENPRVGHRPTEPSD